MEVKKQIKELSKKKNKYQTRRNGPQLRIKLKQKDSPQIPNYKKINKNILIFIEFYLITLTLRT